MVRLGGAANRAKVQSVLESLVEQIKADRSVLAAILCGSLSHDKVWAKSDIDLVVVTIDDKKVQSANLALNSDGVNVHTILIPRSEFRKLADASIRNSFMHSFLAKGRLLYTHDETIADLHARMHEIGERDTMIQLLHAAIHALGPIDKAHKWFITRGDLNYTALWLLSAANPLAQIEIIGRKLLADREVLPQAIKLNPAFFKTVYVDLLNTRKTTKNVQAALDAVDHYLAQRAATLFAPVIDHLRDVGEVRSCTEIEDHFKRNFDISGVPFACEYLADRRMIGKASSPVQLTRKSDIQVQELAFFYLKEQPDAS